jgi:hypothetical protein
MRRLGARLLLASAILAVLGPTMPGASAAAPTLPLGTLVTTAAVDGACPSGHTCQGIKITCPVGGSARAFVAKASSYGDARGVVATFSGGSGNAYEFTSAAELAMVEQLRGDGFTIVQVRWVDPWLRASVGTNAGAHRLACRPATVVPWIRNTIYTPLNVPPLEVGRCGFCITGNSGGGTQVSYALSHYELDGILDAVIATSGPTHGAIEKGCSHLSQDSAYWYPLNIAKIVDSSRGYSKNGPCQTHNLTWASAWREEGVSTGGSDYYHPTTRVHLIIGALDASWVKMNAGDYKDRLLIDGSPMVSSETIDGMGHGLPDSPAGREALRQALLL